MPWLLLEDMKSGTMVKFYHMQEKWVLNFHEAWFELPASSQFWEMIEDANNTEFYIKGRPLIKSNLICPSDKLSWQPGCPVLNINIQGNFFISQGSGSSDNLPENLV